MNTVDSVESLRSLVRDARARGRSIGFVPTMGALHAGHLSLVHLARARFGFVLVSIFVNPLQFSPNEDFGRYPRHPERDADLLASAGADALYLPDPAAFYPTDFATSIRVAGVTEGGEGAMRLGHFGGVATVVAKLFLQVGPDAAFFGRKDLQQVAVVRRLVRDLDFPIEIVVGETVREADGLALSSRNAYLTAEERALAANLPRALFSARDHAARGETDAQRLEGITREALEAAGLAVDYVEIVHPDSMRRLDRVVPGAAIAAAVKIGGTRLIDNVLLGSAETTDDGGRTR